MKEIETQVIHFFSRSETRYPHFVVSFHFPLKCLFGSWIKSIFLPLNLARVKSPQIIFVISYLIWVSIWIGNPLYAAGCIWTGLKVFVVKYIVNELQFLIKSYHARTKLWHLRGNGRFKVEWSDRAECSNRISFYPSHHKHYSRIGVQAMWFLFSQRLCH